MIAEIAGATTDAVKLALDAASLRHQAFANNIANANTPGFMPARVNFEEQLGAFRRVLGGTDAEVSRSLQGVKSFIEQDQSAAGQGASNVMLDMEVVKLSQNVLHYQTLLRGLNKQMSIISAAINEGKR
ncbi:MAG: flagellar basal body rod protein FlgB [Pseudomonadota bacterium]